MLAYPEMRFIWLIDCYGKCRAMYISIPWFNRTNPSLESTDREDTTVYLTTAEYQTSSRNDLAPWVLDGCFPQACWCRIVCKFNLHWCAPVAVRKCHALAGNHPLAFPALRCCLHLEHTLWEMNSLFGTRVLTFPFRNAISYWPFHMRSVHTF